MKYEIKKPLPELKQRRNEILAEYRFYQLDPIRIGREPISIELALLLGLLIDTRIPVDAADAQHPQPYGDDNA